MYYSSFDFWGIDEWVFKEFPWKGRFVGGIYTLLVLASY